MGSFRDMNVNPPSPKLVGTSNMLSSMPLMRLPVEKIMAQLIQPLLEPLPEILKSMHSLKLR